MLCCVRRFYFESVVRRRSFLFWFYGKLASFEHACLLHSYLSLTNHHLEQISAIKERQWHTKSVVLKADMLHDLHIPHHNHHDQPLLYRRAVTHTTLHHQSSIEDQSYGAHLHRHQAYLVYRHHAPNPRFDQLTTEV